jgi:hypothetical protein
VRGLSPFLLALASFLPLSADWIFMGICHLLSAARSLPGMSSAGSCKAQSSPLPLVTVHVHVHGARAALRT